MGGWGGGEGDRKKEREGGRERERLNEMGQVTLAQRGHDDLEGDECLEHAANCRAGLGVCGTRARSCLVSASIERHPSSPSAFPYPPFCLTSRERSRLTLNSKFGQWSKSSLETSSESSSESSSSSAFPSLQVPHSECVPVRVLRAGLRVLACVLLRLVTWKVRVIPLSSLSPLSPPFSLSLPCCCTW